MIEFHEREACVGDKKNTFIWAVKLTDWSLILDIDPTFWRDNASTVHCRHSVKIYIMPFPLSNILSDWDGKCARDLNVVEYWHRVKYLWKGAPTPTHFTVIPHSGRNTHTRKNTKESLAHSRNDEVLCMTHNNVVFIFFRPLTDTHIYIHSHTAVLHYAITPTLWSVKREKAQI